MVVLPWECHEPIIDDPNQHCGDMTLLSKKKLRLLADRHGWSISRAEGYIKGESARRRGEIPSTYSMVGIDDYALGFRAGYFVRESPRSRSERTNGADPKYLRSGR